MAKNKSDFRKKWSRIRVTERAAIIGCVGMLLSAIAGGLFAGITSLIPILYSEYSSNSLGLEAFRVANVRFDDREVGSLYAVHSNVLPSNFQTNSSQMEIESILRDQGFHVFYEQSDFTMLGTDIIPACNISSNHPVPIFPLVFEIWNVGEKDRIIIDDVIIELLSYESPVSTPVEIYYIKKAAMGGGTLIPKEEFNVSLPFNGTRKGILLDSSERLLLNSDDSIVLAANVSFEDPGRYIFRMLIQYHLPDGSSATYTSEQLSFNWLKINFVDGSEVSIVE